MGQAMPGCGPQVSGGSAGPNLGVCGESWGGVGSGHHYAWVICQKFPLAAGVEDHIRNGELIEHLLYPRHCADH